MQKMQRIYDIINISSSGNSDLDDFLLNLRFNTFNNLQVAEFANNAKNINKYFFPLEIYSSIYQNVKTELMMEWIPFSQFTNVKEIAKGGFSKQFG